MEHVASIEDPGTDRDGSLVSFCAKWQKCFSV